MLNFDVKGNLTPYQPILCKVSEMKKYLVDLVPTSSTRRDNYAKYRKYSNDLKKVLGLKEIKQWVNGSFVTKKLNPKDIDFLTLVDHSLVQTLGSQLDNFRPPKCWDVYEVDAYLLEMHPEGSDFHKRFTQSDMAYWYDQFNHTRVNRVGRKLPKGFLEIIY